MLLEDDDSAAGTGWSLSRRARRASAGGQLEQPSEVKSSTRTGVRVLAARFGAMPRIGMLWLGGVLETCATTMGDDGGEAAAYGKLTAMS